MLEVGRGLISAKAESAGMGLLRGFKGVFKAANLIVAYQKQEKQINNNEPRMPFKLFVRNRIGGIEIYKNNPEKISAILKNPNATIF